MKIKSFIAPDMRTALRKIREALGPDAVILSTRGVAEGIEVVASLGYDEAALARVLRAAESDEAAAAPVAPAAVEIPSPPARAAVVDPAAAFAAALGQARAAEPVVAQPEPASLRERARARLKDVDGPTLAELTSAIRPAAAVAEVARALPLQAEPARATFAAANAELRDDAHALDALIANEAPSFASMLTSRMPQAPQPMAIEDYVEAVIGTPAPRPAVAAVAPVAAAPALSLVPAPEPEAPAIAAMRDEMARMRQLMEAQMAQLERERLRGSPARAAAFDALRAFGCEDALAQSVAAQLDPALPVDGIQGPMLDALARTLEVAACEPIDDGGVIALVGPTGAGKTTTAAKLAARFAARHRARDVALITTDCERPGAHEQLQAHGRKLGITVCEARGVNGLQQALTQLADYPLVLVDTTGFAPGDRALFNQILWLRTARKVRSLLVLPANGNPQDMHDVIRRYRPCSPEGLILTKLDETGYLGSALSVTVRNGLPIAYVADGQDATADIAAGNRLAIAQAMVAGRRSTAAPDANTDSAFETRHAV
ncbi:flagellar biosynthesis protein FlhF [Luteimonas terrae]|uniref:Flagellar biosynthesis protein FlhF n=1 Tax=Luteimonas terrae TaxID=1530191 RepID=A0A4R5U7Y0_9GAMM|nr:flagellar biosynthesis protein FlhF [Luteimonas terrae]TDK30575.1 flagellar biosynthesis protein FlhF [Luteimonas terrae]